MLDTSANSSEIRSLRNRKWALPSFTDRDIDALIGNGADALTAPILAARAHDPDEVATFLSPTIRDLLPNPSSFLDMDVAADRLFAAIQAGEQIAIWSDYDVDGATSAATLGRFLKDCGHHRFEIYIPDRITEGYGPNAEGLLALKEQGATLVCILDSGTVAFEPLEAAHDAGLDVVVVDHHAAEDDIPPAVAIVNPNRKDQNPGYGHVCAAGMTFMLVVAANLRLRRSGYFDGEDDRPSSGPDLMTYLDLVALGTVCDVVPLTTINRAFVMRGLPYLSDRGLPGIAALADVAKAPEEISTSGCGFTLGPRINAGGRIGESGAGAALLLEDNLEAARSQAEELNRLNIERQEMEKSCTAAALEQVRDKFTPGETRTLALAIVDAHEGIVGISAARLKEALDAPAFVLAPTPEGTLKGSGRSVSGFDLGAAIIKARKAGLLIKGGGHAMAGGISLEENKVQAFIDFINTEIAQSEYASTGVISRVDAVLRLNQATTGMVDAATSLAPFGMGNPTPRFMISDVVLAEVNILKEKHIKCIFEDLDLGPAGKRLEGLIWNAADTPFGDALREARGARVDVLGGLEINEWRGNRRVQVKIDDVRTH